MKTQKLKMRPYNYSICFYPSTLSFSLIDGATSNSSKKSLVRHSRKRGNHTSGTCDSLFPKISHVTSIILVLLLFASSISQAARIKDIASFQSNGDIQQIGYGLGSDIYNEMFDEKLAEKMSESGQMKIGDLLYKQFSSLINASKSAKSLKMFEPQPEKAAVKIDSPPVLESASEQPKVEVKAPAEPQKPEPANPIAEAPKKIADKKEDHSLHSKFEDMISQAAIKFGLDPALLKAVIQQESGGNPNAVSPDGAKGLMQLVDGTAKMMGVVDPFNPIENIMGGAKYISQLWDRFGGDLKKVIASYNAGPGAVEKFDGVPPYRETRNYVNKVLATYDMENKSS